MSDIPWDPARYFEFVGALITDFANLEFNLRRWLHAHSGMSKEAFQAIVGYPRTDDAISKLKKLLPNTLSAEDKSEVDEAFRQLDRLSKLRNWVVHYGTDCATSCADMLKPPLARSARSD
jgi:hypothetical protein